MVQVLFTMKLTRYRWGEQSENDGDQQQYRKEKREAGGRPKGPITRWKTSGSGVEESTIGGSLALFNGHTKSPIPREPSLVGQSIACSVDQPPCFAWVRARDWRRRADRCTSWTGVTCSAAGRVVALDISGLRRTRVGHLSPQFIVDGLRNLTQLRSFNATGFALPGSIPDWLGADLAPTFATLVLGDASVAGFIPYSFGGVASIAVLVLAGNAITGNIPTTLGQLDNLTLLDLSHNALSGPIPTSLGALANLLYFDLSSNFLSGPVPLALGSLRNLKTLILANNSLSGSVPSQLGDLSGSRDLVFGQVEQQESGGAAASSGGGTQFSNGLHERLVPFLGHCLRKENEKILVYKYVPNGDLYTALLRKPAPEGGIHSLDWLKRLKIATGIAQVLYYLHHECSLPLVHRDIQTSSILLDDKFEVRLGSLSEACPHEEAHHDVFARLLRMLYSLYHLLGNQNKVFPNLLQPVRTMYIVLARCCSSYIVWAKDKLHLHV
ncbi:hypothetical protein OPV22_013459 [Ensete ventricosum]|uniref:Protein kinase domain-containing protein n=1 Tax=Ensete ventricosum TaxID=4639 RepID=A0AAV8PIM5_ENSVE|nr:hypothetical protein OPV22_013459 [Ensete ventricosum]